MNLHLETKTAFISGSTQGIGYAIAKQLLIEGARVIINGRTKEKTESAVNRLTQEVPGARVSGIVADFSKADQVQKLLDQLPQIDILINNVGIFELKAFVEIPDEEWMRFFEINVLSGVRMARRLLPEMLEKKWGRIINISSESAIDVPENMIHYGMTKTAMLSIGNGLAKLTKNTEVTVNTVLGGPAYSDGVAESIQQIATAQNQSVDQVKNYVISNFNPTSLLQRFIEPSEIANLVTYLSSPLSSATNGSAFRVDGGVLKTI